MVKQSRSTTVGPKVRSPYTIRLTGKKRWKARQLRKIANAQVRRKAYRARKRSMQPEAVKARREVESAKQKIQDEATTWSVVSEAYGLIA